MKGKDLLTLAELTSRDLDLILRLSARLKRDRARRGSMPLSGKTQVLLFQKPSTRTRVSFAVAMNELGGGSITLPSSEIQLGRGETVEDTARVLSRYCHVVMARVNEHGDVVRLARAASVPVINGLSDTYHPVQILADMLTLVERKGRLDRLRVAWVGDGSNVCNSWLIGAALAGVELVVATPRRYRPSEAVLRVARDAANDPKITMVEDPLEAVAGADCVMTDSFVSMGFETERDQRLKAFLPRYQVTERLISHAKPDAVFMHCLPAHRGEEVADRVIDGPKSVVFDQAENRLHTAKALLCFILLGEGRARAMAGSR